MEKNYRRYLDVIKMWVVQLLQLLPRTLGYNFSEFSKYMHLTFKMF